MEPRVLNLVKSKLTQPSPSQVEPTWPSPSNSIVLLLPLLLFFFSNLNNPIIKTLVLLKSQQTFLLLLNKHLSNPNPLISNPNHQTLSQPLTHRTLFSNHNPTKPLSNPNATTSPSLPLDGKKWSMQLS